MATRMAATSRDPDEWREATRAARATREEVAAQVVATLADQVYELIMEGDIMGGRALVGRRLGQVLDAERRDDQVALRAAVMDLIVAGGAWVAALDFTPPDPL